MTDTSPPTWLSDRTVVRIGGTDARNFLQGLLTQDMTRVMPGQPQWSGLLSPQGKALFDFLLWDAGDGAIFIDAEKSVADDLVRRLSLYRLRRAVTIEPVESLYVHWAADGDQGVADPRLPVLGRRWLDSKEGGDATVAWRAHRLGHGVTEGRAELGTDKTLWLECNARELNGVSFTKGCYVGQENTARMHHRERINRRLMVAPLAPSGDRTRAVYPELGWMVELRRVDSPGDALIPGWLALSLDA